MMRFSPITKIPYPDICACRLIILSDLDVLACPVARKIFGVIMQITIVNTMYYVGTHINVKVVL